MYIFTITKIRTVMDSVHRSSSSSSSVSAMLHSPSSPRSAFMNLITKAKGSKSKTKDSPNLLISINFVECFIPIAPNFNRSQANHEKVPFKFSKTQNFCKLSLHFCIGFQIHQHVLPRLACLPHPPLLEREMRPCCTKV